MIRNLKRLREKMGVSQQCLASAVGVSQQSINKYENHDVEPDLKTLAAMADFFNTSIDYLIGHSEVDHVLEHLTPCDLNEDEIRLIDEYRRLSAKQKDSIHLILENYQ